MFCDLGLGEWILTRRERVIRRIGDMAARVFSWSLAEQLSWHGRSRNKAKEVIDREIVELRKTAVAFLDGQKDEMDILNDRLSRRFDPAMAFNEAINRAIAAKKVARQQELSPAQKLAFEVQKQHLARVLKNS